MRVKTAISMVLVAGLGLALSAAYYGPAYYGPSVGFYYGGRWGGGWDHDRRWR